MEETTVNVPEAPATVFAFAPEDTSPVDAGEEAAPAGDEAQGTEQTVTDGEPSSGVDARDPQSQKDIGKAFAKESRRIREQYDKKLKEDPYYRLGRLMADDVRYSGDVELSEADALKKATDNFMSAVAKRDNLSKSAARRLYGMEQKEESPETRVQSIIEELEAAEKPEGFDLAAAAADDAFVNLLAEMPAGLAVRLYHAEHRAAAEKQDLAEKLRARQAIPQSMTTTQPVTPKTDWMSASSDAFFAEKERRRKSR